MNQVHPYFGNIVEPSDEGRDVARPRLRRQQRLVGREAERNVSAGARVFKGLARLEPVGRQRQLDDCVLAPARQLRRFGEHSSRVESRDFERDWTVHQFEDFTRDFLEVAPALRHQRGIGGDTVEDAERLRFADFRHVGGVDEELHAARSRGGLKAGWVAIVK